MKYEAAQRKYDGNWNLWREEQIEEGSLITHWVCVAVGNTKQSVLGLIPRKGKK